MTLSRFKSEKGSILVEFAFVSVILVMLLVAIIDFGLVFNAQLIIDNAAREGVRFTGMPVVRTESQIKEFIKSYASELELVDSNISITPMMRTPGQPVTITITYAYEVPVTFGVIPSTFNLTARAIMVQQ